MLHSGRARFDCVNKCLVFLCLAVAKRLECANHKVQNSVVRAAFVSVRIDWMEQRFFARRNPE
jgi:hypothetical protein